MGLKLSQVSLSSFAAGLVLGIALATLFYRPGIYLPRDTVILYTSRDLNFYPSVPGVYVYDFRSPLASIWLGGYQLPLVPPSPFIPAAICVDSNGHWRIAYVSDENALRSFMGVCS